ncbi:MAG: ABC transporter ATP-binding protein [Planctomycetota bacterium]
MNHPGPTQLDGTVIETQDLQKTYQARWWQRRGRVPALRGVTIRAGRGQVFGLLGPNGAGKTTLIKSLLGIIRPTSGSATLFGEPIGTRQSRSRVGYLPESLRIDRHHSARTALTYYGRLSHMDSASIRKRSDELLELVGLAGRDQESVRRFSKGMYQRLGLAQALMHDPDLLILDEPTDGLDPVGRNEVRQVISRLQSLGKTIFLNSHILQEVELVCSQVAILVKGKLRALGTIEDVTRDLVGAAAGEKLDTRMTLVCDPRPDLSHLQNVFASEQVEIRSAHDDIASSVATPEGLPRGKTRGPDGFKVRAFVDDQNAIDQAIDRIRDQGWSIRSLEVQQPTLEDTFIRLVREAEAEDIRDADIRDADIRDAGPSSPQDPMAQPSNIIQR